MATRNMLRLPALTTASSASSPILQMAEVVLRLQESQALWTAGESLQFSAMSQAEAAQLLGAKLDSQLKRNFLSITESGAVKLPDAFDARNAWPECPTIRQVRDQGHCGSCWAFAPTEAFNDRLCIASKGQFTETLSAYQTTACGEGSFGCMGGDPMAAWKYIQGGLATGGGYDDVGTGKSCLPYTYQSCAHHVNSTKYPDCATGVGPHIQPRCPSSWKCSEENYPQEFPKDKHSGAGSAYSLTGRDAIKQDIVQHGPVSAVMGVYEDFFYYKKGVYHHVTGKGIGTHAVKIIGWGTEAGADYWIVANSWNEEWGNGGFVNVKMGECGIDTESVNAAHVTFGSKLSMHGQLLDSWEKIVSHVNSHEASWQAHVPSQFGSPADVVDLCGTRVPLDGAQNDSAMQTSVHIREIPESFDAREAWPACAQVIGHVRDQSDCGSCWAFAATESFNDRLCIAAGSTTLLSVEDTTANCNEGQGCNCAGCRGGDLENPWIWFALHGVVTGGDYTDRGAGTTCAPYTMAPCAHHMGHDTPSYPECPTDRYPTPKSFSECAEQDYFAKYNADKIKASSFPSVPIGVEAIQREIMEHGPVSAAFTVYSDFPTYKSGVYKHLTDTKLGGHGVKILGWGTEANEDYWLIMNSWNEEWGDKGFFKMARGINEGNIEKGVTVGHVKSSTSITV